MAESTHTPDRTEPALSPAGTRAAAVPLPPVDVRRKRPPALSFLLRLETVRRIARVASLLAIDFAGVYAAQKAANGGGEPVGHA